MMNELLYTKASTGQGWPVLQGIWETALSLSVKETTPLSGSWSTEGFDKPPLVDIQNQLFWILGGLLGLLIYRLLRWDKKFKQVLLLRLSQVGHDAVAAMPHELSKIAVRANLITLLLIVLVAIAAVVLNFSLYQKVSPTYAALIDVCLASVALYCGYLTGSMRRRVEADHFLVQLLAQSQKRQAIETKLSHSEQRLVKQQRALTKLTRNQLKDWQHPDEVFRAIARVSAETLDVDRVSVWLFSEDNSRLDCMDLYIKSQNLHSVTTPLLVNDFPKYFEELMSNRLIAADDALSNAITEEFNNGYLQEHNIGAMLDSLITLNDKIVGVVCHEHIGATRAWALDEQNFAVAMADLVRVTLETFHRRKLEVDLKQQEQVFESQLQHRVAAIENNSKLFGFLLQRAPVTIVYMNSAYEILELNPEAERVSGYSRDDAIGRNYYDLFSTPETKAHHQALNQKVAYGKKIQSEEVMVRCADGHMVELSVSRSMELDAEGNPVIISIGQDISKQKALAASLIKARESAESADRIKSMFVASMSHELRTPLNSIIGFLGVVLQGMSGELNGKQADQLGRAYNSAKHLLSLISDVIDISKIEAGFWQIYVESFALKPLFAEIEQVVQFLALEKKVALVFDCEDDLIIATDRRRFYQVVLNVVSNAVKYTEVGSVKVAAFQDETGKLIVTTQDTGIGIDALGMQKLFEPFERIESRLKIKTLGTGLGLYLTRKILTQLLGGEIAVKSKTEEGSLFTITLPAQPPEATIQAASSIL